MDEVSEQSFVDFLRHLRMEQSAMKVRRDGAVPKWDDQHRHEAAFQRNAEVYALMSMTDAHSWQRARILFQLLRSTRSGAADQTRALLERVTKTLLTVLHPHQVFTVFLALRRSRANHKHTTKHILDYLLNHSALDYMAIKHRPILVDCFEHALGKNVARACAKVLSEGRSSEQYVRRNLLRFADDEERAKTVYPYLFDKGAESPSAGQSYPQLAEFEAMLKGGAERPATVTATNRGDISATLVHMYRGGPSPDLAAALDQYVDDAAAKLPRYNGKMALVLDASASTGGYGEREFCCISQSVALMLVLKKCCPNLSIYQVGGTGNPPSPQGGTDLSMALLNALEPEPDVVAVVSDGYENLYSGDLRNVVASLVRSAVKTPIVFCHSKFTWMDDLTLRRPAQLPELEFWHQGEFEDVILALIGTANGAEKDTCLREFLLKKLEEMERLTQAMAESNSHSKLLTKAATEGTHFE